MVVFTCQHCNASLKRVNVSKHYSTVCRNAPYLTCIDCLKDFRGEDYNSHDKCITEDEKYGDKNFKPKPVARKQNAWIDVVHFCAEKNECPKYNSLFSKLSSYSNVPRKKEKFMNFIKSSLQKCSQDVALEVFNVIEQEFLNQKSSQSNISDDNIQTTDEFDQSPSTEKVDKKKLSSDVPNGLTKKKKKEKLKANDTLNDELSQQKEIEPESPDISNTSGPNMLDESSPILNVTVADTLKKKKKKKSKKSDLMSKEDLQAVESGNIVEMFNKAANTTENGQADDKHDQLEEKENVENNQIDAENINHDINTEIDNKEKLSKKQLKKLKKKQKYEAELKNIEDYNNDSKNDEEDITKDVEPTKGSKKRKNRKEVLNEEPKFTNKKLKIQDNQEVEKDGKHAEDMEVEETQSKGKVKFNWGEAIKEVLRSSAEGEISIKRVSKKVLAEYRTVKGDLESYEKLISKFNKKINKTVGVKVLKDKAKLINEH